MDETYGNGDWRWRNWSVISDVEGKRWVYWGCMMCNYIGKWGCDHTLNSHRGDDRWLLDPTQKSCEGVHKIQDKWIMSEVPENPRNSLSLSQFVPSWNWGLTYKLTLSQNKLPFKGVRQKIESSQTFQPGNSSTSPHLVQFGSLCQCPSLPAQLEHWKTSASGLYESRMAIRTWYLGVAGEFMVKPMMVNDDGYYIGLMMVNNNLVCGWPPPLKHNGLRQLGWWTSQYDWKFMKFHGSSHHQPVPLWSHAHPQQICFGVGDFMVNR